MVGRFCFVFVKKIKILNADVLLLGPQVKYALNDLKAACEEKGIPIDVIPMMDYGMMNGPKVLELALKLIG